MVEVRKTSWWQALAGCVSHAAPHLLALVALMVIVRDLARISFDWWPVFALCGIAAVFIPAFVLAHADDTCPLCPVLRTGRQSVFARRRVQARAHEPVIMTFAAPVIAILSAMV